MDSNLKAGWSISQWKACCNDQTDYSIHWDLEYFKVIQNPPVRETVGKKAIPSIKKAYDWWQTKHITKRHWRLYSHQCNFRATRATLLMSSELNSDLWIQSTAILEYPTNCTGKAFVKKTRCSANRNCSELLPEFHPWPQCSAKVNEHNSMMPA